MKNNTPRLIWTAYKNYVAANVMPLSKTPYKDIHYWRNNVFCQMLTYIVPVSIVALVPSCYAAFNIGLPLLGVVDLMVFFLLAGLLFVPGLQIRSRKLIFIFVCYCLSVMLLYYVGESGSGALFLLTLTVLTAIIYSPAAAYYSALANSVICAVFLVPIYLHINIPALANYHVTTWVAVSSNVVFLSFVCAQGLNLLLNGLETTIVDKLNKEHKLNKANNLLGFVTALGRNLLQVQDEITLFSSAANIALQYGAFKVAWVGVFDIPNKTIAKIVQTKQPIKEVALFVNEKMEPNGPQEYVMTTGNYYICNNIERANDLNTWKPLALNLGVNSCLILPIKKAGKVVGSFNLYGAEADFFKDEEIDTLLQVTADISYTLNFLKNTAEKKELEIEVNKRVLQEQFDGNNLAALINNTTDLMWSVDKDFRLITFNQPFEEMGKTNFAAPIKKGDKVLSAASTDEMLNHFRTQYQRAFAGEAFTAVEHFESPFEFWSEISYAPIQNGNQIMGAACHSRDITLSKIAEREIQQLNDNLLLSEQKFHLLYDTTSDAVMLLTDTGFFDCNASTLKMFGCGSKEEFYNKHPADLSPLHQPNGVDSMEMANRQVAIAMQTGSHNFEWVHKRLDTGKPFHADVLLNKVVLNGKPVIEAVVRNIDERKEAAQKLADSEQYHRALIENITDSIVLMGEDGQIIYQSPSAERMSGFSAEDTNGKAAFEFIYPDDLPNCMAFIERAYTHPGTPFQNKYRLLHKTNGYIWIEGTIINLLHNESVKAFIINYRDVTDRVEAENHIQQLNEHLEATVLKRTAQLTDSNKALEAFSYSVSHDLKSPIRAINNFTQIIEKRYQDKMEPDFKELLGYIKDNGQRMATIITDLLKFARLGQDKLSLETVDMNRIVNGTWQNIGRTTTNHPVLHLSVLPKVQADASMIEQVVVNLLSNAIKYSSKKQNPVVTVWAEQTNENVTFFFKDNGAGFDMKNYQRLFGAFQRLHGASEFEGTGVGLMLVKRIIEKHGGTIAATAKVDEGATFYFTLPCLPANR